MDNLYFISNLEIQKQLKADLLESDDSKRSLTEIDVTSARQIFTIMKMEDPDCDANHDGFLRDQELSCLNIIWKTFVPVNSES